jgi:DNA-directed RNA polymerase subunit RPC12/RpoP
MDVVFNCPHCTQELEVEDLAIGQQIDCPSCNQQITIPKDAKPRPATPPGAETKEGADTPPGDASEGATPPPPPEPPPPKRVPYTVPQHEKVEEVLRKKPDAKPEETAPKDGKRRLRTRTIRRNQCMEVGHDKFDDKVTEFLEKIGDENVVSITPITYGFVDTVGHMLNDYGVLIVYKG